MPPSVGLLDFCRVLLFFFHWTSEHYQLWSFLVVRIDISNKFLQHLLRFTSKWPNFYSSCEVVDSHGNKPMTIAGFWLMDPITLIPHVAKGHGDIKLNIKAGGALIFFTTDLTLMTLADIVDAILLQCPPEINISLHFSSHHMPISMGWANPLMDFSQRVSGFNSI